MKIALFYLSVTGNTKHTAELIQDGIKESGHQCDLFNIHNLSFDNYADYEVIGFGSPVFAWREPKAMRKFILNLPKLPGKNIFLFCTCGGNAGNFFYRMAKNLKKKKGMHVFATGTMYYPSSYTVWRKVEGNNDIIKQTEIDKAITFGNSLVSQYKSILAKDLAQPKTKFDLKSAVLGTFSSDRALGWFIGEIKLKDGCTQCGKCKEICPDNAISLDPFPSINKKLCTGCCGCINICPVRALDSQKTQDKERYQFKSSLIK